MDMSIYKPEEWTEIQTAKINFRRPMSFPPVRQEYSYPSDNRMEARNMFFPLLLSGNTPAEFTNIFLAMPVGISLLQC